MHRMPSCLGCCLKLVEAKVVLKLESHKDDVDFRRNRLRLINEKNIEEVDVSSRCIALIGNAIDETISEKKWIYFRKYW